MKVLIGINLHLIYTQACNPVGVNQLIENLASKAMVAFEDTSWKSLGLLASSSKQVLLIGILHTLLFNVAIPADLCFCATKWYQCKWSLVVVRCVTYLRMIPCKSLLSFPSFSPPCSEPPSCFVMLITRDWYDQLRQQRQTSIYTIGPGFAASKSTV